MEKKALQVCHLPDKSSLSIFAVVSFVKSGIAEAAKAIIEVVISPWSDSPALRLRAWNREMVEFWNYAGRTWIQGLTATYMGVYRKHAADMYRRNVDG